MTAFFRRLPKLSLNRSKIALIAVLSLLFATGTSALALRAHFPPTSQFQALDITTSQLNTIYSFSLGDNISLATNNFTILYNSQSQNASVANNMLFGSFSYPTSTAVDFQENAIVNVAKHPYFQVSVTTAPHFTSTSGFAFGLRFLASLNNGSVVQLVNDKFLVEHVASGTTSTLSVYVPSYRADIENIIGIRLYVEERARLNSTYSIIVNSIVASSLNQVPYCSSPVCYVPLNLSNGTGYFDALVVDAIFIGRTTYNIAFSYQNQTFVSKTYSNGSSHVSITAGSENIVLTPLPLPPTVLYVISTSVPLSVNLHDLKLTFTSLPAHALGSYIPGETEEALLLVELSILFVVPAELLLFRFRLPWRITMMGGIIIRLIIMPWTGHPSDTLTFIRSAYLYYHAGWAPIFYNPPTLFALSIPIGSMQFYYLLGLDRIDPAFLFHYGGVLATFFVKIPFVLADVVNAVILSKVSQNKTYALFYFLNPFSIYVSSIWGQYEGLTTLALIAGYVATVKLKSRLAALAGFSGFLLAGLIELFGFIVVPLLAVYLAVRKNYVELALAGVTTLLVLIIPSSLNQYIFSFRLSSPVLHPGLYSLSGNLGINSQLPLVAAFAACATLALYDLITTGAFIKILAPVSAGIISFELFAGNHPQIMLIPLGLMTLLFAVRNDTHGLMFVWICGALLTFITIVGTQSFAYLLTGRGYYMIPLIEGGQHLKFYALGLVIVSSGLIARASMNLRLFLISSLIVTLVSLEWFLVNFV